jgi:predicted small metal-binding protein
MNQVTCECGFTARAAEADLVMLEVLSHVRTEHPDLVGEVMPNVVRNWIERAPDRSG